jgi:hypothetical protein
VGTVGCVVGVLSSAAMMTIMIQVGAGVQHSSTGSKTHTPTCAFCMVRHRLLWHACTTPSRVWSGCQSLEGLLTPARAQACEP